MISVILHHCIFNVLTEVPALHRSTLTIILLASRTTVTILATLHTKVLRSRLNYPWFMTNTQIRKSGHSFSWGPEGPAPPQWFYQAQNDHVYHLGLPTVEWRLKPGFSKTSVHEFWVQSVMFGWEKISGAPLFYFICMEINMVSFLYLIITFKRQDSLQTFFPFIYNNSTFIIIYNTISIISIYYSILIYYSI